jgi:hypothetical protein
MDLSPPKVGMDSTDVEIGKLCRRARCRAAAAGNALVHGWLVLFEVIENATLIAVIIYLAVGLERISEMFHSSISWFC